MLSDSQPCCRLGGLRAAAGKILSWGAGAEPLLDGRVTPRLGVLSDSLQVLQYLPHALQHPAQAPGTPAAPPGMRPMLFGWWGF